VTPAGPPVTAPAPAAAPRLEAVAGEANFHNAAPVTGDQIVGDKVMGDKFTGDKTVYGNR